MFPAVTCGAALFTMKRTSSRANQTPLVATYGQCHCAVYAPAAAGHSLAHLPCTCDRPFYRPFFRACSCSDLSYDLCALQRLGLLLGVDIGNCSAAPARMFVRDFMRSSERCEPPCAHEVVVDVPVQLSAHELLLVRAFKFDNAGSCYFMHPHHQMFF